MYSCGDDMFCFCFRAWKKKNKTMLTVTEDIDMLLGSLKILSILKPGQKICGAGKPLNISIQDTAPGWITEAITRFWLGDSRETTLRILHAVFDAVFAIADQTLGIIEAESPEAASREERLTHLRNSPLIKKLQQSIGLARKGIQSLCETYASDVNYHAKLLLLDEKIESRLEEISFSTEFIQRKRSTSLDE
jgi:hypothetical protein